MYSFPAWRRAPFIALLIIIFVIAYAPATTQGTATVRLSALISPSNISHLYISVSSIQLHREGFLNWTTISQSFPVIDLLSPTSQSTPQTITSASVPSDRYDSMKIIYSNSTVLISGQIQHPAQLGLLYLPSSGLKKVLHPSSSNPPSNSGCLKCHLELIQFVHQQRLLCA